MTRPLHAVHLAVILITVTTTAACATAPTGLSVEGGLRAPVGARLVPQPLMSNDPSLRFDVSAYYLHAPGQIEARVRIEPEARMRSVTIEWWSEDGAGGSHLISLDGERSARVYRYPIKRMSEGAYRVAAILRRSDGSTLRRERRVVVIGESAGAMGTPIVSIADEPPL